MDETILLPVSIERLGQVYEDRNHKVEKVVARFEGFDKEFYVSDFGSCAAMLAVRDGSVLMARQYRLLINALSLEIPGGAVDPGEEPAAAAIRECFEETGVRCSNVKPLVSYRTNLDMLNDHVYIFYTDECTESSDADPERYVWVPMERCLQMISGNQIQESRSILALLTHQMLTDTRRCPESR